MFVTLSTEKNTFDEIHKKRLAIGSYDYHVTDYYTGLEMVQRK